MGILNFDKPKKVTPTQEHNDHYSSDSGIAGTYVQNMSDEDRAKWKAKKIGGDDPRVEIRKTLNGTQIVLIVRLSGVTMSANGKMVFKHDEFEELSQAVAEANACLSQVLQPTSSTA